MTSEQLRAESRRLIDESHLLRGDVDALLQRSRKLVAQSRELRRTVIAVRWPRSGPQGRKVSESAR